MNEYLGILALAVCILPALALISLLSMAGSRGNRRHDAQRVENEPACYYSEGEEREAAKVAPVEPVKADMGYTNPYPRWQARFQAQQNERDARRDACHEQAVGGLVDDFFKRIEGER